MADEPLAESEIEDPSEAEGDADDLTDVHQRALRRFDTVAMPQQEMRAQALEARRFVTVPGAMWEGAWGWQNDNAPRPEVDKITKSLEKIETDYRENRIVPNFLPADDVADEDTADTLAGLHRADSYHFKAQQGRDNAFQEALRGGFGAYRLTTDYADPYDPDCDEQRINPGVTIVDADQSVFFDGSSKLYDKSDAKWAFIITAEQTDAAAEKWGEENITPWPNPTFKYAWDWFTPSVVRIAEYYEVEDYPDRIIILNNDLTGEEMRFFQSEVEGSEITDLIAMGWTKRARSWKRPRVHKYILNGNKILKDCGYIAGPNIPIVPVYGRREFVDNMERFRGHVQKKMDRQRIYNSAVAKIVETQSMAPYEVPIVAPEQLAGFVQSADGSQITLSEHWARGNIERLPLRVLLPLRNSEGEIVSAGPLGKIEPPQVQPATAALLQVSSADLTDDDDNSEQVKSNVSADAMDIAASRVDAKSGIYLDNMRQSVQREAEIYLNMAIAVYYEPDRKVDTMTEDGQNGTATLAQPKTDDTGVYKTRNDLSRGRYKVVADVQESTATKRQKTVRQNIALAEVAVKAQAVDLAQAALLTAVMNQDGEGMQDMQAFARHKLISLGVVQPTPEEQTEIQKAQAAQQQGQPSPADQALMAEAGKSSSQAQLNQAKAVETLASAHLKTAQAEVVGGPDKAPEVPTGLSAPEVVEKLASADLKSAQAAHLRHGMGLGTVKTAHDMHMAERAQSLAEKPPQEAA